MCTCACVYTLVRAEPVLARIKEDHKRIILPSIDNIKHDTFEVERYENSGHGYNWELWCMYINPPKQWWDEGDMSAPIRWSNVTYTQCNKGHCLQTSTSMSTFVHTNKQRMLVFIQLFMIFNLKNKKVFHPVCLSPHIQEVLWMRVQLRKCFMSENVVTNEQTKKKLQIECQTPSK